MIEILKDMIQAVNLSLLHRSVGAIYLLEPLLYYIYNAIFSVLSLIYKQL